MQLVCAPELIYAQIDASFTNDAIYRRILSMQLVCALELIFQPIYSYINGFWLFLFQTGQIEKIT